MGTEGNVLQESRTVNRPTVILYDLDSTLFNVQHREHLSPVGPNRADTQMWVDYSKGCINDTVVEGVAQSARLFKRAGHLIYVVSGRNIEAYQETVDVMAKYNVPWDVIRLHHDDDLRHNGEFKSGYINELKAAGLEPVLMFEDHIEVCEMIEELTGVPCLTVRPRYEDKIGVSFNLGQHAELVTK